MLVPFLRVSALWVLQCFLWVLVHYWCVSNSAPKSQLRSLPMFPSPPLCSIQVCLPPRAICMEQCVVLSALSAVFCRFTLCVPFHAKGAWPGRSLTPAQDVKMACFFVNIHHWKLKYDYGPIWNCIESKWTNKIKVLLSEIFWAMPHFVLVHFF